MPGGRGNGIAKFLGGIDPEFNGLLAVQQCLHIGFTVSHTARQIRHFCYIKLIFLAGSNTFSSNFPCLLMPGLLAVLAACWRGFGIAANFSAANKSTLIKNPCLLVRDRDWKLCACPSHRGERTELIM